MEISQQDKQTLIANEGHMLTAKDGWVQQVYDLEKLHAIYEKYVGHYPLTTWCGACVVKFMQRLAAWWDVVKAQPKLEEELKRCPNIRHVQMCTCKDKSDCSIEYALIEVTQLEAVQQPKRTRKR